MAERAPSREERALWRAAMRDVTPLADGAVAAPELPFAPAPEPAAPAPRQRARRTTLPPPRPLPAITFDAAPGLDRRSAERLKRGRLSVEARLDLHGMTQAEAHGALDDFVARAQAAGRRCVLVITGKGLRRGEESGGESPGVLRAAVPRWLNEAPNRARLLAFVPAQPKDGGSGALYLLLRRRRAP